jgi:hypothetical protein
MIRCRRNLENVGETSAFRRSPRQGGSPTIAVSNPARLRNGQTSLDCRYSLHRRFVCLADLRRQAHAAASDPNRRYSNCFRKHDRIGREYSATGSCLESFA